MSLSARRIIPAVLLMLTTLGVGAIANPVPPDSLKDKKEAVLPPDPDFDAVLINGNGVLKVKLLDARIEVMLKGDPDKDGKREDLGKIKLATKSIRKIECANRLPPATAEKIEKLIAKMGWADPKDRESAMEELRKIGGPAYHRLVKAQKHDDLEIQRRAEESVKFLNQKLKAEDRRLQDCDIVYTWQSVYTCMIVGEWINVSTLAFREQRLGLEHVRTFNGLKATSTDAPAAPANMSAYPNQPGKEFTYTVTGATTGGTVYGSGPYTIDSNLGMAAVHAGLVEPGKTAVIKVLLVESPVAYPATTQNGVTSTVYGQAYQPGAYQLSR